MKTSPLDYLLSSLCIVLLAAAALAAVGMGLRPATSSLLGGYHVVIDSLAFLLVYGLLSAAFVRALLAMHPLRPGEYDMDHPHFAYWKLFTVIHEFGRGALLPFTTVFAKPLVAKLFGAKMGKNIAMGAHFVDPPLIEVGDDAILGLDAALVAHAITSGRIVLKKVKIGRGATVGVHAVVMPGVVIGEGSVVTAGSVVKMDTRIPPGELWGGIPAGRIKALDAGDVRG